ncbi:MAG TPA: hypothetical protein VF993_11800 [Myxococcales bacterium]
MANAITGPSPTAALQPRGIGDILGEAFELYKKNAVLLIVTAAVAMGPVYVVKDAIMAAALAPMATTGLEADTDRMKDLQKQMEQAQARGASPAEIQSIAAQQMEVALGSAKKGLGVLAGIGLMLLGLLLTIPFMILAVYLAQAALTVLVADRARAGTMGWQEAWQVVLANLGSLVVTSLMVMIGVAVGLVFCILPGLVFSLFAALTIPVLLLEKKSGTTAIRRSVELVKADWLRVVVVLVIFGILQAITSWVGGLIVPSRFYFLHMLVGDLVSIAVLPIPIIGLVLLYQDIARAKLNVPEETLAAQRAGLLTPSA